MLDSRSQPISPANFLRERNIDSSNARRSIFYERFLHRLNSDDIAAANRQPIEFIYPYARLQATEYSQALRLISTEVDFESDYKDWQIKHLQDHQALLRPTISGLSAAYRSLSRRSDPGSASWRRLKADYDEIIAQAMELEGNFKDHMSRYVSIMALRESKKSIQQADSVRRITQLAFIFVPLTFVTSVFGMNLAEFGTGSIKAWIFVVVAIAISLTVFAMLILSPGLTRWYLMHFRTIRVIVALFKYLPVEAFWFLVFCLYHRPKTNGKLLGSLGLYHWLLSNGDEWYPPNAFRDGTDLHLSIELSPFWLSKADLVWKFFSQEGWKGRTFYWRLRNGYPKILDTYPDV